MGYCYPGGQYQDYNAGTLSYLINATCFKKEHKISSTGALLLSKKWALTHWGGDKMDAILQMSFSNAFPWMKR